MKVWHVLITIALITFAADPAFACAVCFDANEESRAAFLGTTALLSLLPLGMIGGLVFWVWRRSKAMEDGQPLHP